MRGVLAMVAVFAVTFVVLGAVLRVIQPDADYETVTDSSTVEEFIRGDISGDVVRWCTDTADVVEAPLAFGGAVEAKLWRCKYRRDRMRLRGDRLAARSEPWYIGCLWLVLEGGSPADYGETGEC